MSNQSSTGPVQPLNRRPLLIGLIGGVASGKSTVAQAMEAKGALWLDADKLALAVLQSPEVVEQLLARYSDQVLGNDGQVNRHWLASRVFGDDAVAQQERHWLEKQIHPRVLKQIEASIAAAGNQYPAIIIDAPLLLEAGWASSCDRILFVDTPVSLRRSLATVRGWTPTELDKRESSQMDLATKRQYATDAIANDSSEEQLLRRVEAYWRKTVEHPHF